MLHAQQTIPKSPKPEATGEYTNPRSPPDSEPELQQRAPGRKQPLRRVDEPPGRSGGGESPGREARTVRRGCTYRKAVLEDSDYMTAIARRRDFTVA